VSSGHNGHAASQLLPIGENHFGLADIMILLSAGYDTLEDVHAAFSALLQHVLAEAVAVHFAVAARNRDGLLARDCDARGLVHRLQAVVRKA
jgi:hypothetical protein